MWNSLRWLESRWSLGISAVALALAVALLIGNGSSARAARIAGAKSHAAASTGVSVDCPAVTPDGLAVVIDGHIVQPGQAVIINQRVVRLVRCSHEEVQFESLDDSDELCRPHTRLQLEIPQSLPDSPRD